MKNRGMIIVAGGMAKRFGGGNKLLIELEGLPVFLHGVKRFANWVTPGNLVVVTPETMREEFRELTEKFLPGVEVFWANGGAFRSKSVENGLAALEMASGLVAIHDAARPLASLELLSMLLEQMGEFAGVIPGKPVTDTLKRSDGSGKIVDTVDRAGLWRVETPQLFDVEKLREAYRREPDTDFTDDAGAMAAAGFACKVVHHPGENLKITYASDAEQLSRLLREKR